jgi:hypothetical protein
MVPKLPHTGIRLSTSASFFVLREDALNLLVYFQNIFQPRTEIKAIQRQMKQVLGIVGFSEDQGRTADPRWEIDSDIRGEPIDVFVSPVTRYFTLRRAVLYSDDLIKVLGFEEELRNKSLGVQDAGLLSQTVKTPFIFIKKEVAPDGTGIAPTVTFYRKCQFASLKRSYTVEQASSSTAVFEDATIYYAGRQQFTAA